MATTERMLTQGSLGDENGGWLDEFGLGLNTLGLDNANSEAPAPRLIQVRSAEARQGLEAPATEPGSNAETTVPPWLERPVGQAKRGNDGGDAAGGLSRQLQQHYATEHHAPEVGGEERRDVVALGIEHQFSDIQRLLEESRAKITGLVEQNSSHSRKLTQECTRLFAENRLLREKLAAVDYPLGAMSLGLPGAMDLAAEVDQIIAGRDAIGRDSHPSSAMDAPEMSAIVPAPEPKPQPESPLGFPQEMSRRRPSTHSGRADPGPPGTQRVVPREDGGDQPETGRDSKRVSTASKESPIKNKGYIKQNSLLPNRDSMKEKIQKAIAKETYDVADKYWDTGLCQAVARNQIFENVTLVIVTANAFWLWYDTDSNTADVLTQAPIHFFIVESLFCLYFTLEWIIRFCAFKHKLDSLWDGWFVFDSSLLALMVMETWVMTFIIWASGSVTGGMGGSGALRVVRLLRLARLSRMARIMRAIPELVILIKGIAEATRSVLFTLLLLLLIIYVYAILFTQLAKQEGEDSGLQQYFSDVPTAINYLLIYSAFPDLEEFLNNVLAVGLGYWALLISFVVAAALTVMNMLVGVLVEVVSAVSVAEREQIEVSCVKHKLLSLMNDYGLDRDGDMQISRSEFESLLENAEACRALQAVGVDVIDVMDYTGIIFEDDDTQLPFPEFMEEILKLRGTNKATVKDVVDLRRGLTEHLSTIYDLIYQNSQGETRTGHLPSVHGENSTQLRSRVRSVSPSTTLCPPPEYRAVG